MIVSCSELWPSADPRDGELHWNYLAGKLGAKSPLTRPLLLGIRGATIGDSQTHDLVHAPVYDDAYVLLQATELPIVSKGATHAYQRFSSLSPKDGPDGIGDVGSVRPGKYVARDPGIQPYPVFIVTMPDGNVNLPAFRDFDHDGHVTEAEENASVNMRTGPEVGPDGCWADSVLIHTGFDGPADSPHHSSIACSTAPLAFLRQLRLACAGFKRAFDYWIVDAWDLVPLVDGKPTIDAPTPENIA